jgi:manganese/zinc/iron transport system ATP- binding protein
MVAKGKTVVVVHHDLNSAEDYFNWILFLNMRLVASGPTKKVFTQELLQETYGGKLTVLARVGDLLEKQQLPTREK